MDFQSYESFQPSWPFYNIINPSFDYDFIDMDVPDVSSIPCLIPDEAPQFPACSDDQTQALSVEDFLLDDSEGFELDFNGDLKFVYGLFSESEDSFPSSTEGWSPSSSVKSTEVAVSIESTPVQPSSLILPGEQSELDDRFIIVHLLKAYGEAVENQQSELADVIMKCLSEKVCLAGDSLLRLVFYLCQDFGKRGDYLKIESSKNFEAAFRAIYEMLPYGRFAHFAANSAILEAVPADADSIHIVDFDLREGIQWPPVLENLARLHKAVKLTAIRWGEEDCNGAPQMQSFKLVKRRLADHARLFGLKLRVEEIEIGELISEIKKTRKRGGKKEWLVFNCMEGLPHIGRVRNRKLVEEFVRTAKDLVANSAYCNTSNRGIIILGDGHACQTPEDHSGFGSFFEANLQHYQALLESIEMNFPVHLAEARTALESLFVMPFTSSTAWFQRWIEMKECCNLQKEAGLEGWRFSGESLEEARELVKGKQSLCEVKIGGDRKNEMILEWRGTPLVRVSAWRS